MYYTKKLSSKLLYKKLLYLKKDVKNSDKILKFKKKKWQKFQQMLLKSKKKKFYDPVIYSLFNFKSFFNKKFKYNLHNKQRLSFFYGKLKKFYLKKLLKEIFKKSKISKENLITLFIQQLENRLDTILYRTHFAYSVQNARQLISHKKVYVNGKIMQQSGYVVKKGDLITFKNGVHKSLHQNIFNSNI